MIEHNTLLKGEHVEVIFKEKTVDEDGFGDPIYERTSRIVENVLVVPGSGKDASEDSRYQGVVIDYTLHFPKTFIEELSGAEIVVRGHKCRVVGHPDRYNPSPGDFDMPVYVEVIDG